MRGRSSNIKKKKTETELNQMKEKVNVQKTVDERVIQLENDIKLKSQTIKTLELENSRLSDVSTFQFFTINQFQFHYKSISIFTTNQFQFQFHYKSILIFTTNQFQFSLQINFNFSLQINFNFTTNQFQFSLQINFNFNFTPNQFQFQFSL